METVRFFGPDTDAFVDSVVRHADEFRERSGLGLELRTDATGSLTALVSASACFNPNGLDDFYATPPTVACCTLSTTKGDTTFADTHVYLVIKTDSLAAGASRTFQFGYLLTLNATKTAQTITFPQPAGTARSAGPVTMAATASSGLASGRVVASRPL